MSYRELVRLAPSVHYFPASANAGLWDGPRGSVLVDSGSGADAARRILKTVAASGRSLAAVFLTHANSDHSGGAAFISDSARVPVYSSRVNAALCADPILSSYCVWGGYPAKELRGSFFMQSACPVVPLAEVCPPPRELDGAELVPLPGHFVEQHGLLAGGVLFAADALFSRAFLARHPLFFLHDVAVFLESLDRIAACPAGVVLPSHGEPVEDASSLCAANRAAVETAASFILEACAAPSSFEDALAAVCCRFGIALDWTQYAMVGSTVRAYLGFLRERGALEVYFERGRMYWKRR